MDSENVYDIEKAVQAQLNFCAKQEYPRYAPIDGWCPNCHWNIYSVGGYDVRTAGTWLITSCPRCHYSFID